MAALSGSAVASDVFKAVQNVAGGSDPVSSETVLSDLGIDSLALAELLGLLEDSFGPGHISIDDLLEASTVGAVVARLSASLGVKSDTPSTKLVAPAPAAPAAPPAAPAAPVAATPAPGALQKIATAVASITGQDVSDFDSPLQEAGVDSLGLAELLGFLEDSFGTGCITIDELMTDSSVREIAIKLGGAAEEGVPAPVATTQAPPVTTSTKAPAAPGALQKIATAVASITGQDVTDFDSPLQEAGVDSLGLAELLGLLEDSFGTSCITIDELMTDSSVREIATKLGGAAEEGAPAPAAPPRKPVAATQAPAVTTSTKAPAAPGALQKIATAVASITGQDVSDFDSPLQEAGVDSLGLAELLGLLEESFGTGCITIDELMTDSSVREIATKLGGAAEDCVPAPPAPTPVAAPRPVVPSPAPVLTSKPAAGTFTPPARVAATAKASESGWKAWVRTTHVGSLPRPRDGNNSDLSQVLAAQAAAGVDVVNDGEWTRDNYIADVIERIEGLRGGDEGAGSSNACCAKHSMPVAADMHDVPIYSTRFTGGNGLITLNPRREATSDLACVSSLRYVPTPIASLQPFCDALKAAGKPISDGFYSVPSPGTLALFCEDTYFRNHASYIKALGNVLREEYRRIAATGLQLQVDCPDLAMGRHTRWANLSDEEFVEVAKLNIAALNEAVADVPTKQTRVHVCWGNYAGPHHKDMPADLVWPLLGTVKAKYLLVEGANARHRNDIEAFERAVKNGHFRNDQVIVPGMLDTTTARVEHPELIASSLLRYIQIVGDPSRVMAGTDCGFASTAKSVAVTGDIAWMKLAALAEGAALATQRFIARSAPVPCRSPLLAPTPFRVAIIASGSDSSYAKDVAQELCNLRAAVVEIFPGECFEALRWAVDMPLTLVGVGAGTSAAEKTLRQLQQDKSVSRRAFTLVSIGSGPGLVIPRGAASEVAAAIKEASMGRDFDKRSLVLPRTSSPPEKVDVVVVGAGLLGMLTAKRCLDAGFSVAVLEQRPVVGGIWSMYANSFSQVNSSEGGYCIKELIGEENGINGDNRDHSTAAEVLRDFAKLGDSLRNNIYTNVKVVKVMGAAGDYQIFMQDESGTTTNAMVASCRGVVLCINDRVGLPRPLQVPGKDKFHGVIADGTSDSLATMDWRGKRVVVAGMGAFAVENARTALENGAAEVVVVSRRHGTICPKMIDYLNFVKPWDEHYKHDTQTNVKQFLRWKELYSAAGCTVPECWPKQVKHEGHTISVSDLWFIGHHMKKLSTRTGGIAKAEANGVQLTSGEFVPCDVVVGCIGFERSNYLCEALTGRNTVMTTNYLDKDMMYLADAEIDEGAFNSFFGSSVLEYGKFFTNVYVEGLKRGDQLGEQLWGSQTEAVKITERKWNQYINAGLKLIEADSTISKHAREQVENRTRHFWRTMPPQSFLEVNRKEWEELHTRLNGGVPVPKSQQLPYFFDEAPEWC